MNRRMNWILGLLALFVGACSGWLANPVGTPPMLAESQAQWGLIPPSFSRADLSLVDRLRSPGLWQSSADSAQAKVRNWTLAGIFNVGQQRFAYVLAADEAAPSRATRVRAGDVLPDGAKVLSVKTNALEIERDGRTEVIELFRQPRLEASDEKRRTKKPSSN